MLRGHPKTKSHFSCRVGNAHPTTNFQKYGVIFVRLLRENASNTPAPNPPSSNSQTTLFERVGLAYQQFFKDRGISSSENLLVAYRTEKISAQRLVRRGIETSLAEAGSKRQDKGVD